MPLMKISEYWRIQAPTRPIIHSKNTCPRRHQKPIILGIREFYKLALPHTGARDNISIFCFVKRKTDLIYYYIACLLFVPRKQHRHIKIFSLPSFLSHFYFYSRPLSVSVLPSCYSYCGEHPPCCFVPFALLRNEMGDCAPSILVNCLHGRHRVMMLRKRCTNKILHVVVHVPVCR